MPVEVAQSSPSPSGASADEKANVIHIEDAAHLDTTKMSNAEKVHAIDAIAENPNITLESFAHLDIKKILRKIDMRLIPMLTALVSEVTAGNPPYCWIPP